MKLDTNNIQNIFDKLYSLTHIEYQLYELGFNAYVLEVCNFDTGDTYNLGNRQSPYCAADVLYELISYLKSCSDYI